MSMIVHKVVRSIFYLFWIFPIKKNRVIFTAYKGAQFSCNPKYIFIELYDKQKDKFEFVWCLNDATQLSSKYENVKIAKYKSLKHIYYQITSNVVILNHANPVYIPLRKKQLKINTWHGGGAYKKVSRAVKNDEYKFEDYKALYEIKDTDYFISSSRKFTEVMVESQMLPKSVYLEVGMPRNDLFFRKNEKLQQEIKDILKIDSKIKTVLYAPTYRGAQDSQELNMTLDVKSVLKSLKGRFMGEWLMLMRTHINTIKTSNSSDNHIIDVTSYPDMQELLLIADVLITDYSSSIWDFSLTKKPAFLFTPDLEKYIDKQGFYTDINEWSFPYSKTNEKLMKDILEFDNKTHENKIKKHLDNLVSFEKGIASSLVRNIILNHSQEIELKK